MKTQLLILSMVAVLMISACSSDDSPLAPSTAPPPAPVSSVVREGRVAVPAEFVAGLFFRTDAPGDLEVKVNWTRRTNTVFLYVAEGRCTLPKFRQGCPFDPSCPCDFAVRSEVLGTEKPRNLFLRNASQGRYTLILINLGPHEDVFSYEVLLTTTAGTSAVSVIESEIGAMRPQN